MPPSAPTCLMLNSDALERRAQPMKTRRIPSSICSATLFGRAARWCRKAHENLPYDYYFGGYDHAIQRTLRIISFDCNPLPRLTINIYHVDSFVKGFNLCHEPILKRPRCSTDLDVSPCGGSECFRGTTSTLS